jgi:hypothetical protein
MSPPVSSHSSNGNKAFPDQIPRGLRLLRSGVASSKSSSSFGAQLQAEAAAIERWWAQPRWQHTKRIYSGTLLYRVWRRRYPIENLEMMLSRSNFVAGDPVKVRLVHSFRFMFAL